MTKEKKKKGWVFSKPPFRLNGGGGGGGRFCPGISNVQNETTFEHTYTSQIPF